MGKSSFKSFPSRSFAVTLHAPAVTVSTSSGYLFHSKFLDCYLDTNHGSEVDGRMLYNSGWIELTLPTSTGSGPVYSSMTKNWFQTHPRLDLWSTCPSFPPRCLCLCSDMWPTSTTANTETFLQTIAIFFDQLILVRSTSTVGFHSMF